MIEIARISTIGTANRRDIVRRLMEASDFFKRISFADAIKAYRFAECNNLVVRGYGYLAVYHICD